MRVQQTKETLFALMLKYNAVFNKEPTSFSKHDKFEFVCPCGIVHERDLRSMKLVGPYCKQCALIKGLEKLKNLRQNPNRIKPKTGQEYFSSLGCVILHPIKKHYLSTDKITYSCSCGQEVTKTYKQAQRSIVCKTCNYKRVSKTLSSKTKVPKNPKYCTHCKMMRETTDFQEGLKHCAHCRRHRKNRYLRDQNVAADINETENDVKMCVRCYKVYDIEKFQQTHKTYVLCLFCRNDDKMRTFDFKQIYYDYKQSRGPCVDCGENNIRVLDFDHIDREQKSIPVSRCLTLDDLYEEGGKCEMRCVMCHIRRTKQQMNYGTTNCLKKRFIDNIKLNSKGCEECGWFDESLLEGLDFDHLDPKCKNVSVSHMVNGPYTIEDIKDEISMCRILCRKCHRLHTLKQFGETLYDRGEQINCHNVYKQV
jgi:hypothetical protein